MRRRIIWRIKLPLLLITFSAVPLGLAAYLTHQVLQKSYENSTVQSLETLAQSQGTAVEQFSSDRQNEVERIAQLVSDPVDLAVSALLRVRSLDKKPKPLPDLLDAEVLDETPDKVPPKDVDKDVDDDEGEKIAIPNSPEEDLEAAIGDVRHHLGLVLWDQTKFEELLVMGIDGEVLISTFQLHEGTTAENLEYFKNGIGATYVQPVFRSPITDRLTMVISTPIRNDNAQVVAVLAARLNLSRFFNLINKTVGLGDSGETVVGKLIGNEIVLMAPTRHAPNAALEERVTIGDEFGMAMQKAAAGQRGNDRTVDYRGKCVYAAWERIPSLDWALAVKLDCAEALEPAQMAFDTLMRLLLLVSLLALVAAVFVAHALVAPLNALRNAADSISRGNFDVRLPIPPGDETGDLAESFERMIAAIKFFREQVRPEDEADLSGEMDAELIGDTGEDLPPVTDADGSPASDDPRGDSK